MGILTYMESRPKSESKSHSFVSKTRRHKDGAPSWEVSNLNFKTVLLSTLLIFGAAAAQQGPSVAQQSSPASQQASAQANIKIETLAQSSSAWDGTPYVAYPSGQPQITVRKITIAPHSALEWHSHAMPTTAYVLSGELTVEKKDRTKKHFAAGEVVVETVGTVHRGFTGDQPATLIVFYPGTPSLPLSQAAR